MNIIRRRHSIHGAIVTVGTSGEARSVDDGKYFNNNDDGDDDVSIEFETIMAQHNSTDGDNTNKSSKGVQRFSQSERNIRMNHSSNNNSFRNIRTHMLSKVTSIRNMAQQVVQKSVNKVRLTSVVTNSNGNKHGKDHVVTSSPHKLKQKYHEMMASSGELSMACTSHVEKSDDEFPMMISPENAMLLQKSSNHTGTTRNLTLEDSNNDMDVEDMYHDAEPLLIHSDRHLTGSDSFREYLQIHCHPNVSMMGAAKLMRTSSDRLVEVIQQQQLLKEQFESDYQSVNPTTTNQDKDKKASLMTQHVSPRALRKFRLVGILEESLEECQPKIEPIYIRATDLLPNSPRNSPTPFGRTNPNIDDVTTSTESNLTPSMGGRIQLRRVRSVRGGRRTNSSSSLKSSPSQQPASVSSGTTSRQNHHPHHRVHPKEVIDRMSFGPASKHHYRSQSQRSLMVTNYQNLLIDIDPDNCRDHRHRPSQRIESKLELMKPINDYEIPLSVQRLKRAKTDGICMEKTINRSTTSRQLRSTTPSRERVQFDFNPKDLNELCKTIELAKVRGNAKSFSATTTKSPTTKNTAALTQPMIDTVDAIHTPIRSYLFS